MKLHAQGGFNYKTLRLPNDKRVNAISDIVQSGEGYYWIATNDGLYRYDGFQFLKLHPEGDIFFPEHDLKQVEVGAKPYQLWVLSNKRTLYELDIRTLEVREILYSSFEDGIVGIYTDSVGTLYGSTGEGHVIVYEDQSFTTLSKQSFGHPTLIEFVHKSKIWLNAENQDYIVALDRESGLFTKSLYATVAWLERDTVHYINRLGEVWQLENDTVPALEGRIHTDKIDFNISENRNGNIWLLALNGSIYFREESRNTFRSFSEPVISLLGRQHFHGSYLDQNRQLWIGTSKVIYILSPSEKEKVSGLKKVLNKHLQYIYEFGKSSRAVVETDSTIWISTYGGMFMYDREKDSVYPYPVFSDREPGIIPAPFMEMILLDNGQYLATSEGNFVSYIDLKKQEYFNIGTEEEGAPQQTFALEYIDTSLYMVGSYKGLHLLSLRDSSYSRLSHPSLHFKEYEVWDIETIGKGQFAIATENGLYIIDTNKVLEHHQKVENSETGQIYTLMMYEEELYIACEEGLFRRNKKGVISWLLQGYEVFSIRPENERLWIGTDNGLLVYYLSQGSFFRFSMDDGLTSNEFNRKSTYHLQDGQLVFGGINGINIIDPETFLAKTEIDSVVFSQVTYSVEEEVFHRNFCGSTVVYIPEWTALTASFMFADRLIEGSFTIWTNKGNGWENENSTVLEMSSADPGRDTVLIKLQFPSGAFSNIVKLVPPKRASFSTSYLWFLLILPLLFFIVLFFRKRKLSFPDVSAASIDENDFGKKCPLLLVRPIGKPDEEQLYRLHKIQSMIIEDREQGEITAASLASKMNTSERQLYRVFKEYTDLTPRQFVNKVRISYSLDIIYHGNAKTVSEVAQACGFQKASYYSRLFKEEFGKSPKEVLKSSGS